MIDPETERAVAGWMRLSDDVTGERTADERARCERCDSTYLVLRGGEHPLCAHCYLERGAA